MAGTLTRAVEARGGRTATDAARYDVNRTRRVAGLSLTDSRARLAAQLLLQATRDAPGTAGVGHLLAASLTSTKRRSPQ